MLPRLQDDKPRSFVSIVPNALDTSEDDMIILRDAAATAYSGKLSLTMMRKHVLTYQLSWFRHCKISGHT